MSWHITRDRRCNQEPIASPMKISTLLMHPQSPPRLCRPRNSGGGSFISRNSIVMSSNFILQPENVQDELSKIWCYVSGEHHLKKDVKATYIVPKSLESNELAYVFGMGESLLSPRNS